MAETWKAHVEKYNGLVERYNALRQSRQAQAPTAGSTSGAVMPAAPPTATTVTSGPTPDWVASMQRRLRAAAKATGNWAQFTTYLQSATQTNPPIRRRQGADGKYIYSDKHGQATAAELGFKAGELKQLIEAPIHHQYKGPKH